MRRDLRNPIAQLLRGTYVLFPVPSRLVAMGGFLFAFSMFLSANSRYCGFLIIMDTIRSEIHYWIGGETRLSLLCLFDVASCTVH